MEQLKVHFLCEGRYSNNLKHSWMAPMCLQSQGAANG